MNARRGLDSYEPVEDRLRRFWTEHQHGRILTDLVHRDDRQYVIRAEVYTDRDDTRPAATGYAEELIGSNPVNKTNALENAETSAVGRALANLNYAPKGARPSREEMTKATRPVSPADQARAQLKALCAKEKWDLARVAEMYAADYDTALKTDTNAERIAGFMEILPERADQLKVPAA